MSISPYKRATYHLLNLSANQPKPTVNRLDKSALAIETPVEKMLLILFQEKTIGNPELEKMFMHGIDTRQHSFTIGDIVNRRHLGQTICEKINHIMQTMAWERGVGHRTLQ